VLATQPLIDESHAEDIEITETPELLVEDISFAYPSTGIPVISGCSLIIRPGEKVALVGRNGSGKTTLQRLIAKIYVPTNGSIWIDGHEIRSVRQQSWLNYVVVATQELKLPSMEIARALTGHVATEIDKNRMGAALVFSGADDVVTELPDGINTWIGEDWPTGRGFSTGQMQRLALAGAFYRFLDPKIFVGIFDEPMANCDVETRARFYQSVSKAPEFRRKTVIMSLHDPLYLQHFDRVLLLQDGKVAKDLRGHDEIVSYRERIAMTLAGDL
jgi:ATP-binding cassette subfamily B protein